MIECFAPDGHLTDDALHALIHEQPLDELTRLEIAEHFSFCDRCIDRYTALLTDGTLLTPEQPVCPGVLRRLRERARRLFFNRYCTAAAAAVFAIVFWNIGVFEIDLDQSDQQLNRVTLQTQRISERANQAASSLFDQMDALLNQFSFERSLNNHEKK